MKGKRQPPCADRREPGAEGSAAGTPALREGCAIRRGVPPERACGEAAAAGNRGRHAEERRKVRREWEQKLTPKRRGGGKDGGCELFPVKAGGCGAAATWDLGDAPLRLASPSPEPPVSGGRKAAAVLGGRRKGGISARASLSRACSALPICFKIFIFYFPLVDAVFSTLILSSLTRIAVSGSCFYYLR